MDEITRLASSPRPTAPRTTPDVQVGQVSDRNWPIAA